MMSPARAMSRFPAAVQPLLPRLSIRMSPFPGMARSSSRALRRSYCGTITGFGPDDAIILDDVAFSKGEYAIWCNGKFTIYECGAALETIAISGNYERNSFAVTDEGGKAEVVFIGDEWIGPSSEDRTGTWTTDANWALGVPTSQLNAIVDLPGAYTITTCGDQVANSLAITDADATLKGSGSLTLGTLENHGTIKTTDEDTLVINIKNGGTNSGTITAEAVPLPSTRPMSTTRMA